MNNFCSGLRNTSSRHEVSTIFQLFAQPSKCTTFLYRKINLFVRMVACLWIEKHPIRFAIYRGHKSISTRHVMCVFMYVCVSCAKKLMVDLEIAYLPFYSLFKAMEIGELIKSYSFVSFHYFVSLLREQC